MIDSWEKDAEVGEVIVILLDPFGAKSVIWPRQLWDAFVAFRKSISDIEAVSDGSMMKLKRRYHNLHKEYMFESMLVQRLRNYETSDSPPEDF